MQIDKKDKNSDIKCPICNMLARKLDSFVESFDEKRYFCVCDKCNHAFLFPLPAEEKLDEYYKHKKSQLSNSYMRAFRRKKLPRIKRILEKIKFHNVLEVGAGSIGIGSIVQGEYSVIESSKENIKSLKKQNPSTFFYKHVDDLEKSNACFDLIFANAVLEHVKDPIKFLSFLDRKVMCNGHVAIGVPDRLLELPILEFSKDKNLFFCKEHLHSFSKESLTYYFISNGYDIVLSDSLASRKYKESVNMYIFSLKKMLFSQMQFSVRFFLDVCIKYMVMKIYKFLQYSKNDDRVEFIMIFRKNNKKQ